MSDPRVVVVAHAPLTTFCAKIFVRAGVGEDEAERLAHRLMAANLTGHDSHGVGRVPRYVRMMGEGLVVPGRSVSIVSDGGAHVMLDGNKGFGQTIGEQAVAEGVARAGRHGIAIVGLANAGHLGRIGDWAEDAAADGFISIHFVNVRGRSLAAPYGGIDRRMATSPFCVGVPLTGEAPIVLDFATSLVAEGKALVAATGGAPLPEGALIDSEGRPSTDPYQLYGETVGDEVPHASMGPGAMAVFGGHKGSGLNFMIEILAGALTGSGVNRTLADAEEKPFVNGMLSIYIDPEKFAGRDAFEAETRAYADYVRSARPAVGHEAVLLPGDSELTRRAQREREGVPMSAGAWDRLVAIAAELGIPGDEVPKPMAAAAL